MIHSSRRIQQFTTCWCRSAAGWHIAAMLVVACVLAGFRLTPALAAPGSPLPDHAATAAVPPKMILQLGNSTTLNWMAVSPDGKRLVTIDQHDGTVLWDLRDGTVLEQISGISADEVMFSADNKRLLFNTINASAPVVWDIAAGHSVPVPKEVSGFGRFTTDGNYWEYRTPYRCWYNKFCWEQLAPTHGKVLEYLRLEKRRERELPDVARCLQLCSLADGQSKRSFPGITGLLLDISRDNRKAVTLTGGPQNTDGAYYGGDRSRGTHRVGSHHRKGAYPVERASGFIVQRKAALFSPDGSKFAAASCTYDAPPDLRVWDTSTGALLTTLNTPVGEHGKTPPPLAITSISWPSAPMGRKWLPAGWTGTRWCGTSPPGKCSAGSRRKVCRWRNWPLPRTAPAY